jgi:hypothetical protein
MYEEVALMRGLTASRTEFEFIFIIGLQLVKAFCLYII